MKRYELEAVVTISIHTTVHAESLEEALAEAESRPMSSIHEVGEYSANEFWCTSGELDGEPESIRPLGEVLSE